METPALRRLCCKRATRLGFSVLLAGALWAGATPPAFAQSTAHFEKPLLIYSIDVEGGQSTLFVTPSGGSLLVDTGWPGSAARDPRRIQAAMQEAGITRLDHVLITHFHDDHVGGVPELVKRVPVGEFLDHGSNREDSPETRANYAAYLKAIDGKPRRILKPGDVLDISGLHVDVLVADGRHVDALPGVTPAANPACASERKWPEDLSENAYTLGMLLTFGKFRMLDLGDLTGAKEVALVCPSNPIGTVDLYLTTHHGLFLSNARAIVDAVHPRVAIMNNGARKGGSPDAWQTIHDSPGLEDLWQLHTAEDSDSAHNAAEAFIANPKGGPDGGYLKVTAYPDGSFSLFNPRSKLAKTYPAVH